MEVSLQHPAHYLPESLAAALQAAAPEAERIGHLHMKQLATIYKQGWFNALVPRAYGGQELLLPEVLQLEEALAWADGSTGWVVTLCSGAGWFAGFLDPSLASDVFQDPQACIAGSGGATGTATLTDSGYTINGYWKYASGALHATAFTANCILLKDDQPVPGSDGQPMVRPFLLKKNEVQIHATWNAMGMMATGSHAFEVRDVAVPANRCFTIDPAHAQVAGLIYQYPFLQLAETTLAVNLSGMAIRFLDLCATLATIKSHTQLQRLTSNAQHQLNQLRQAFYITVVRSWHALQEGRLPPSLLSVVSKTCKDLVHQSRSCVNELYPYCGLEAADKSTELNRVWRNLHTAGQHALFGV